MNDFLSKLSIYDQLGYLAVGGLFYIFLHYDQMYINLGLSTIASSPFSVAIAVYFLGHLAQAIPTTIKASIKRILKQAPTSRLVDNATLREVRAKVGNNKLNKKQAFQIIYLYALTVDKTGRVEVMNARYGLFRGWACVLALQALASLVIYCYCQSLKTSDWKLLIMCLICVWLAVIMKSRSDHFYQEIGDKTINTYLLTKAGSLLPGK